ncbi:hypothetical protein CYD30_16725 [Kosakonia cowanii]|uniref:DUF3592 domain-containing protein n=1 Tax=Kosakonia cowanii JCM 10956 = DSM 18146 TaxID=1300165 RepID=A0A807LA23_9ENTR|nr:hypothetical protein BWI95_02795 [Kosakonia cowanii JCM 10956 = DSM 18146]TNL08461.1 hypothetical protein CYD30_16725 [Kosakonia cowanii]
MDNYLKAIPIILVTAVVIAIVYSIIRSIFDGFTKKKILSNPCYVDATITQIIPRTPSNLGIVSIYVDYQFTAENGETYENKNVLINIKTMDLYNYKQGSTIPVVYLKSDPTKNILNMRDAMLDYKRR